MTLFPTFTKSSCKKSVFYAKSYLASWFSRKNYASTLPYSLATYEKKDKQWSLKHKLEEDYETVDSWKSNNFTDEIVARRK